nr:MAG TPA: crystallin beta/gamma motif-containing protein [Caudoviricetes sp.]
MGSGRDEFLRQLFQQPHGQQSARIQKQQTAAQQFMEQLPRNQIDAYRNSPQGMAEIDGVVGMSPTAAQLVRSAQQWGGKGTGDAARAVIQSPATIWGGLKGGVHALNSGFYRAADDLSFNSFGTGTLGDWAKNQSNLSHDAQRNATINYQTDIGRDVGQGLNSFGATAPLTVGALAMKNPAIMYGGMGAQTGLTEYGNARDAGVSPIPAAIYATTQGAIEVGTEKLPAGALVDMVKSNRPLAALVKAPARYALGEGLGEQVATLGQDYMQAAYLDAPKNANWQQDYWNSRGEAARTTAVSSLVSSGGNVGLGAGGVAVQRGVNAARARQKPPVQRFMQQLDTQTAQPQAQPAQQPARPGRMAKGSGNAVVDTNARIQQATANGGYQTRQSPAQRVVSVQASNQMVRTYVAKDGSTHQRIGGSRAWRNKNEGNIVYGSFARRYGAIGHDQNVAGHTMAVFPTEEAGRRAKAALLFESPKYRNLSLHDAIYRYAPPKDRQGRVINNTAAYYSRVLDAVGGRNKPMSRYTAAEREAIMQRMREVEGWKPGRVVGNDTSAVSLQGTPSGRLTKGGQSIATGSADNVAASPDTSPALPDQQAAFSNGMEDNSQAMQEMQRAARESQAAAEEMREQSERLGRQTKVYLDNQMRQARLQLMEADELAPSVAGTDNQYRDRSRAASQMQVNHIAQNLEPELLGDSKEVGTGAPTLANDGRTIIGGNGRVMGLAQAYANGNGEGYRQYLMDNAEQFGLSRDEIARMNKPVLVRQLDESVDIAKAAVASNEGGGLGMSALEQARADADRLPDFGRFIADDSGELNTAANRGFIRDFVGAMPHTVRAQMVDADGRLSQDGVRRLRNALLYRAYGNSPTLSWMVESTDQGARNLVNALVQAAPKIAQARDNIRAGAMHDADIAEEVVQAAEKLNQIREQGDSVADYLAQQGLFGEEMNAVSRELLAFFEEHKRSGKAIATLLRNYYDALAAQGNPNQQDVFGEQAAPDKQQLLEQTINDYEQEHGRSTDSGQLFGRTAERPAGEPVSETEPQPASRRSDEAGAGENQGGTERDGERSGRVAGEDAPKLSRSASTQEKYEQRIDELFARAKADTQNGVTVLDRSDMLDMLGFGDKPLKLAESKVLAGIDNHPQMTAEVWKRLPDWIDHPAMVFDSDTVDGRLVFIAPEKVRGSDVRIVIEPKGDALEAHVLVNAYDTKSGATPYMRWARDRLLRYADKEKASRIDERFGLRLPDILRNPAFMPDAQIHGMGRGNMKALRRTKILTEKNLQGYLKRNPSLSVNPSRNTQNTVTPERVAEIRQQVERAVGRHNMRLIDVLTAAEASRQDGAQDLRGVDGWYDPKSKRITLIADNLPNARAAQFAAWHELGHRKIDVAGWQQWRGVLEQSRLNPTIRQLARTILRQRKAAGEVINLDIATEEAAVELYSAMKNSDYAALEDKYKVSVPLAMRGGLAGYFARFAQRLQSVLAKAFGIRQAEFGDGEVFELLRKIDRAEEVESQAAETTAPQDTTLENNHSDETAEPAKPTEKFSRSESALEEKPGWLDRNELGEWEKGLALYHGIGRLAKPLLAKLKLANTAPQEFTEMMRDYRSQLNVAGMAASEMAKAGVQMTADERALLSDILEKELPPGIEVSPEMQELAGTIRELLSRQGEQLADLGMLSRESLERFKDTYLPRLYRQRTELFGGNDLAKLNREFNKAMRGSLGNALGGQHLKGRGIFKTVSRSEQADYEAKGYELRQDFGNQGKHAGKVLMWRDYTREERAQMGEERDAILRFTQGYVQTQADLAKGVLFQRIAQNEELASKTEVEGWKPVPNTTIAGTGGVHRYGALAGMWVHPDVFYHLEQQFAVQNAALKIWRASLGWWKMTKTVYNPVAHTNNVVSNFSLLFIAGGRVRDLQPAAASIRNKDALYREALELGLVGEAVDSAGIRELFTGLNNTDDDAVITDSFFRRVLKRADRLALGIPGKISDKAQTFYWVEDEVFKMALYRMARSKGLSNTEARDYTLNFFFDYGEVPQGIKFVRDTGLLPFVSYTYKAIPAVLRGALTRPHRFLAVTGLMYALNAMSYAMLGDDADEEEERKYMPEYMKGMTSFGTPKLIRLPWNDSQGKPMFIDVYRWLPLGDFADVGNRTGGMPLPQFMNPNGPVVSTYNALINNTDTFTGGKLTHDYMTTREKTVIRAKWIAGQILPASVGMPFSYHTNNVLDGVKNSFEGTKFSEVLEDLGWTGKTYRGEDKQLYRALFGSVGFKIRGERPEDWKAADRRRRNYEAQEIRAANRRTMRDNSLSQSAKDARLRSNAEHMQNLFKED